MIAHVVIIMVVIIYDGCVFDQVRSPNRSSSSYSPRRSLSPRPRPGDYSTSSSLSPRPGYTPRAGGNGTSPRDLNKSLCDIVEYWADTSDFLLDAEEEYDGQAPMKVCYRLFRELRHLIRDVYPLELLPRPVYLSLAEAIGDGSGYRLPCSTWAKPLDHLLLFIMDHGTPAFRGVMEGLVVEPQTIKKEMEGIDIEEDHGAFFACMYCMMGRV